MLYSPQYMVMSLALSFGVGIHSPFVVNQGLSLCYRDGQPVELRVLEPSIKSFRKKLNRDFLKSSE